MLGLSTERALSKQDLARQHVESMKDKPAGSGTAVAAGVSPHAPYSTPFDLVAYCVDLAREQQIPLAMHVAESDEERQLIEQGNGPFLDQLASIVPTAREHFPWGQAATYHLIKLLAAAPYALLVHTATIFATTRSNSSPSTLRCLWSTVRGRITSLVIHRIQSKSCCEPVYE